MNRTFNVSTDGVTEIDFKIIAGAILWLTVVFVIVLDLLLMAAVIADTETARSIRWISGNILMASVLGALGSALSHILQAVDVFDANFRRYRLPLRRVRLSVVGFWNSNMAQYVTTACLVFTPLYTLGNSGRVLMATFYAITVFVVVKWWNKPVLAPRNTKYFIIATVFVWVAVVPFVAPSLATDSAFCTMSRNEAQNYIGIYSIVCILSFPPFPSCSLYYSWS